MDFKDQKVLFSFSFITLIAVLALVAAFFYIRNDGSKETDSQGQTPSELESNFELDTEYKGNSKWEYKIAGYLPNPCYSYLIDEFVLESFPEQVKINMTITEPAADVICTQVIQDVSEEGTFSASEGASVELVVLEN